MLPFNLLFVSEMKIVIFFIRRVCFLTYAYEKDTLSRLIFPDFSKCFKMYLSEVLLIKL